MNTSGRWIRSGVCAALGLAAVLICAVAAGQATTDETNTVVVCNSDNPLMDVLQTKGYTLFETSIADGVQAIQDAIDDGSTDLWTLLVVKQYTESSPTAVAYTLTASIQMTSTYAFRVIGYPREVPQDVIIAGPSSGAAIELDTVRAGVVVEGVTLRGGEYGIHATGDCTVTVQRCYITGNTSHGVWCQDLAKLNLVNCSISDNTGDGVHAQTITGATVIGGSITFPFDDATKPSDWTIVNDAGGEWAYGAPAGNDGDPVAGNTGNYVFGMNLAGNYQGTEVYTGTSAGSGTTAVYTFPVPLTDVFPIGDVNVVINLTKTTTSTLRARLTPPGGGPVITLFDNLSVDVGGLSDTILDDEAATLVSSGSGTFSGSFKPLDTLNLLNGGPPAGDWTLTITDITTTDTLTLGDCRLVVTPPVDTPHYVVSPEIPCTAYSNPQLVFAQQANMKTAVTWFVDVSTDDSTIPIANKRWGRLWTNDGSAVTESGWSDQTLSRLAVYAANQPTVYIRWGYELQEGVSSNWCEADGGWNIDDVRIVDDQTPKGYVRINHCSIIQNGGNGVYSEPSPDSDVSVIDSIVYNNTGTGLWNPLPSGDNFYAACNFVTGNATDYDGVAQDAASVFADTDPLLDSSGTWVGKLAINSPLLGKASTTVTYDFEYERRPSSGDQDIGADEIGGETSVTAWLNCWVDPPIVGRAAAGSINVIVELDGEWDTDNDVAYIVPQGRDPSILPTDTTHPIIPLTLDSDLSTYGILVFHNTNDITTSLSGNGNSPSSGDYLADGHAAVCLYINSQIWGDSSTDPLETAAEEGRHLLIDTIPPRLYLVPADRAPVVADFVTLNNAAPYATGGVTWDPLTPLPETFEQGDVSTITSVPWHGTTALNASNEPMAFFNAGSQSNGYTHTALDVVLTATFVDPDVYTEFGWTDRPDAALDTDHLGSGTTDRQVSGFLGATADAYGVASAILAGQADFTDQNGNTYVAANAAAPVRWVFTDSGSVLSNTDAQLTLSATDSGANAGFFGSGATGGDILGILDDTVSGAWSFGEYSGSWLSGGIPIGLVPGWWHVQGPFTAIDRAANSSTLRTSNTYYGNRPLHLWWLLGAEADMDLDVKRNDQPGIWPSIEWAFNRGYSQQLQMASTSTLGPVYAHAVWVSTAAGEGGMAGPYEQVKAWTWNKSLRLAPEDFDAIESTLSDTSMKDHWVLVTLGVVDEAGNVKPWPTAELYEDAGDMVLVSGAESGANWVRFYIPSDASQIDTLLTADLFHYAVTAQGAPADFGAVQIVSYPLTDMGQVNTAVGASFTVRPSFPTGTDTTANLSIEVELLRDGVQVYWGELTGNLEGTPRTITFPTDVTSGDGFNPNIAGDGGLRLGRYVYDATQKTYIPKIANYVFRATAKVVVGAQEFRDSSPAQFSFKLVPGAVSNYIESGKQQPVKVHETR